ncbi:hypothetical protein [Haliangium sp.]|uniref:hypothetical protein n=1 Tax=Haliangium sp. TaxID=2663208 RepID=UPI003D0ED047
MRLAPPADCPAWAQPVLAAVDSGAPCLIITHGPRPDSVAGLGPITQRLLAHAPTPLAVDDHRALSAAPPGTVWLLLGPARTAVAELARSLHHGANELGLRVLVWVDTELAKALHQALAGRVTAHLALVPREPDLPTYALRGLYQADRARAPGVSWHGPGAAQALRALSPELAPELSIREQRAGADYQTLVEAARESASWLVIHDLADPLELRRIRWALAEAGRVGRCVLEQPACPTPGWWPIRTSGGHISEWTTAPNPHRGQRAALLAALLELEPGAVVLAYMLSDLTAEQLAAAPDPAAAVARDQWKRRRLAAKDIDLFATPRRDRRRLLEPLYLRALHDQPEVETVRADRRRRAHDTLCAMADLDRVWSAPAPAQGDLLALAHEPPDHIPPLPGDEHARAELAPWVELVLRTTGQVPTNPSVRTRLCAWALQLGLHDVVRAWLPRHADLADQVHIRRLYSDPEAVLGLIERARLAGHMPTGRRRAQLELDAALACAQLGFRQDARAHLAHARRIWAPYAGENAHVERARLLGAEAQLHLLGDDAATAADLARRALNQLDVVTGPVHPALFPIAYALAKALIHDGADAEAERVLRFTLTTVERARGTARHDDVALFTHLLGISRAQRDPAASEKDLRRALELVEQVWGPHESPARMRVLIDWGMRLYRLGSFDQAERAFDEALAIADALARPYTDPLLMAARYVFAHLLLTVDRPHRARHILRPAWEAAVGNDAHDHIATIGTLFVSALERTGAQDEADAVRAQLDAPAPPRRSIVHLSARHLRNRG